MAIQFFCVACRQPIEIDDEFANQTVTCPYCRKVVTAPAATDQTIQANSPTATPSDATAAPVAPTDFPTSPPGTNVWSWASLGCITATLIVFAILLGI